MKKLFVAMALVLVIPQFAFAVWWNPFSWGIFNFLRHEPQIPLTHPSDPIADQGEVKAPQEPQVKETSETKTEETTSSTKAAPVESKNSIDKTSSATLAIDSPSGGETWIAGLTYDVDWHGSGLIPKTNHIVFYLSDGSADEILLQGGPLPESGISSVYIPAFTTVNGVRKTIRTGQYRLHAVAYDHQPFLPSTYPEAHIIADDYSNSYINVKQGISVISPSRNLSWQKGSSQNIVWSAAVDPAISYTNKVDVYLLLKQTGTPVPIALGLPNSGTYGWQVGKLKDLSDLAITDGTYSVKVCYQGKNICAESDGLFNLYSGSIEPQVQLLSPNGGQILKRGQAITISWSSSGVTSVPNVDIMLVKTVGSTDYYSSIANSIPNTGSYVWQIPAKDEITSAGTYKIMVRKTVTVLGDPVIKDISDSSFNIEP